MQHQKRQQVVGFLLFLIASLTNLPLPSLPPVPEDESYGNNISWDRFPRTLCLGPQEMQCWIHPHLTSETSWSTVFGGDVGETETSLHSCTKRGSTHRRLTSVPREAAWTLPDLSSAFAFPAGLLTTQHGVGRSARDQPPSGQPHIVLWLSEPVHDLLTHHCSLSVGRACRGATRKDHRLAASGMETQRAERLPLPGAASYMQYTTGRRDRSGDQQLQRHWQPPLTGMKQK